MADRYHLTPLVRAMTSPHDLFVLALSEESVRLIHAVANLPPAAVEVPNLSKNAEEATHRPSIHVRASRGHLQNLEGEKVLLHQFARRIDQALRGVLAGRATPLVLDAAEPIASVFRSVNSHQQLVDEAVLEDATRMTRLPAVPSAPARASWVRSAMICPNRAPLVAILRYQFGVIAA